MFSTECFQDKKAKTAEKVPSRVSGALGLASALAFLCMVLEEFPVSGSVSLSVEEDLDLRGSWGD